MIKLTIKNLSLSQIATSGQCFRWKEVAPDAYEIPAFGKILMATQNGDDFIFNCTQKQWDTIWSDYFDIQTDYGKIIRKVKRGDNDYLKACVNTAPGMRILRQDLWETIVSFIISQRNGIKRIKTCIERLCNLANLKNGAFPQPNDLDAKQLLNAQLGVGYRAQYLHDIYIFAQDNPDWLDYLRSLNYDQAMEELMLRNGIGPKVANCICLFGLHHICAFPIDTHVQDILNRYFPRGFDFDTYSSEAGIIQQYMFYNEIN